MLHARGEMSGHPTREVTSPEAVEIIVAGEIFIVAIKVLEIQLIAGCSTPELNFPSLAAAGIIARRQIMLITYNGKY